MLATLGTHTNVSSLQNMSSRHSNTAGIALPSIPRRASGSHPRPAPQILESLAPVKVVVQQSTPPSDSTPRMNSPFVDSDSSSSTNSDNSPPTIRRPKFKRGFVSMCPPEQSTPTPAVNNSRSNQENLSPIPFPSTSRHVNSAARPGPRPLMYTPGIPLRQQAERPKGRNFSESHVSRSSPEVPTITSSTSAIISQPNLIRKKSGEPVKSSMKSSKSLTIITPAFGTKSEPTTPTHQKAVHFDAQLEHVKLFLAEQKPLAVSRDGSPTDDSCTDSDFPSFIFGDSDEKTTKRPITMQLQNMPDRVNLAATVAMEGLSLAFDGLSINGRVRVRNIAYTKVVAVRFTFDNWQTTSEVTGKYLESLNKEFDRFTFSIRLNDILSRIESKQLFLAVRYSVAGQEFWDNNYGMNYRAEFKKAPAPPSKPAPPVTVTAVASANTSVVSSSPATSPPMKDDLANLKSELEKVVKSREHFRGQHLLNSTTSTPTRPAPLSNSNSKNDGGFAARYKFDISSVTPWKPSDFSPARHLRTTTHPALRITPPSVSPIPWPDKVKARGVPIIKTIPILGSPRDLDEESLFAGPRTAAVDGGDAKPSYFDRGLAGRGFRNHKRGSFDENAALAAKVKRTPPSTPLAEAHSPTPLDTTPLAIRVSPFPSPQAEDSEDPPSSTEFGGSELPYGLGLGTSYFDHQDNSSELSTPSFASPCSSSAPSTTSSPTQSFLEYNAVDVATSGLGGVSTISPKTSYRQFLNKFCYFTGSEESEHLNIPEYPISRTQSASDIEDLLSTTPHLHALDSYSSNTPTRSPSYDDLAVRSGSSTPTSHSLQPITIPALGSPVPSPDARSLASVFG